MSDSYRRVTLLSRGWRLDDVLVARTFRDRLRGLNAGDVDAVLLRVRSVHTFGVDHHIRITPITGGSLAMPSLIAAPGRVYRWRRASWVLETGVDVPAPPVGGVITVVA
ncbi:MAG TPA: hypothetical protein VLA29_07020 [Acidimicrobiia bacterium]|nr:hypothetical protein [Acidimicrobiia bacterium]